MTKKWKYIYCYKFLLLNFKRVWLKFPLSSLLLLLTSDFRKETRGKFKFISVCKEKNWNEIWISSLCISDFFLKLWSAWWEMQLSVGEKLHSESISESTFVFSTKQSLHLQWKEASHADIRLHFTWFLTYWFQTSGIYTLQIKTHAATQARSNTLHRWWEERFKEGILWEAGALWKQTGRWDMAGIVSSNEKREDDVVTPAGVWRACSLRRTSRRCCRTLCPSGGLPEPCNHECPWNTAESCTEFSNPPQDERSSTFFPSHSGKAGGWLNIFTYKADFVRYKQTSC